MTTKRVKVRVTEEDKDKRTSISCEVNGVSFYAEGPEQEVTAKLREFMDEVFGPIENAMQRAGIIPRRPS